MAEPASVKEINQREELVLHRGLVLLGGLLAGAGLTMALCLRLILPIPEAAGIAGLLTLGGIPAHEGLKTILIVAGGIIGAAAAQWVWLILGRGQRWLCRLPLSTTLKRASVPFAVFLPQITYLYRGEPALLPPLMAFIGLAAGFLLLAWLERGDKRKIFFAHPTEARYNSAVLFTHGGVIVLGACLGWFLQSLPAFSGSLFPGLWFPLGVGIGVWVFSLLLAALFGLYDTKHTFDQIYLAIAISLLPLALLPLQTIGWYQYFDSAQDKILSVKKLTWLPILLISLVGTLIPGLMILNFWRLRGLAVEWQPAGEELFRALMLIAAFPIIICAVAYWPAGAAFSKTALAGPIDFFHEGESLSTAQAMLAGRLPFKEILLRHGFLSDAVSGLAAVNWMGNSFESYRFLMAVLAPLGLVAVYLLAIFCLPWIWAVLLSLVLLTGSIGTIPGTRFFFTLVGFIFTLYYIQKRNWAALLFSGLFTALALIASYTAGLTALAGHLVLLTGFAFFVPGSVRERLAGPGIYLGVLLAVLLPWWLYLAMSGILGAYFQNFIWVLSTYEAIFGLPLPGIGADPGLGKILTFLAPPLIIAIGGLYLLNSLKTVREHGLPWNILLMTALTGLFWMRFLKRSDVSFLQDVLPIAAMLTAFFLYRLTARQGSLRGLLFLALLPALFIPRAGRLDLTALAGGFGSKNQICVEGLAASDLESMGDAYLPEKQARGLEQIVAYLDEKVGSAETFFDFSNRPLLYFLVPRRPVVKSLSTMTIASFQQQLEAIRSISLSAVKTVVCRGHLAGPDNLDDIPVEVRQYAVSEYLLRKFTPAVLVADTVMLSPVKKGGPADKQAAAAMFREIKLKSLPYNWGRLKKYAPVQGREADRFLLAGGAKALEPAGLTATAQGEGLDVGPAGGPVKLRLVCNSRKYDQANVLVMDLKSRPMLDGKTAWISWGKASSRSRLGFTLQGDNQTHRYVFRIGALPSWVYAGRIDRLHLEFPGGGWTWEGTSLIRIEDIPELRMSGVAGVDTK